MTNYGAEDLSGSNKSITKHEKDMSTRNLAVPLRSNSSIAPLLEPISKRLAQSASRNHRVASFSRKGSRVEENQIIGLNTSPKNYGRRTIYCSPKNAVNQQAKTVENLQKNKNEVSSSFDTFTERLQQLQKLSVLPNYEPSRNSQKAYGIVKAFGVCTNIGLVRDYNEDRVSIVLDIPKPLNHTDPNPWPNCSIFAIFDGHGGSKCADFLRNNFHYYIVRNKWFPVNPEEALKQACEFAERRFIEEQLNNAEGKHDPSGSCGLVLSITDDNCYICNIGDSRAVASRNNGRFSQAITRDHKPSDEMERTRILNAGGRVYQNLPFIGNSRLQRGNRGSNTIVNNGPHRILPGGLAVSRAFGDIEAKLPQFGGNSNVLIAKPEITILKIDETVDFIVLGSDGIYDSLSNDDVIRSVWDTINKRKTSDIHELMRIASENLIKEALLKKSYDNVTAVIVAFASLEQKINSSKSFDGGPKVESETNEAIFMSPKPNSAKNEETEEPTSEVKEYPKTNSPPNEVEDKTMQAPKISPSRAITNTPRKKLFKRDSSKKGSMVSINKESSDKKYENLPRILPRVTSKKKL